MDELDFNNVLNIIEYLNVLDSSTLSMSARRYYYLVHEYRRLRGPEVVTASSWDPTTFQQRSATLVASEPIRKLQKPPNLVLAFNTNRSTLEEELSQHLPPTTVVLGACADSIQVNLSGVTNVVESHSNASVMMASFPNADILPFCFYRNFHQDVLEFQDLLASKGQNHWKAIIVYASGIGLSFVEAFVSYTQANFPDIAIVGGMCSEGYVTRALHSKSDLQRMTVRQLIARLRSLGESQDVHGVEKSDLVNLIWELEHSPQNMTLQHADDGVFGVALGGDVPVRSMVSRGVKSILHGTPQPTSPYLVKTTNLCRPDDPDFIFQGHDLDSIHMIHELSHRDTGCTITAMEMLNRAEGDAEFIGVKRPNEEGFVLHMIGPYCQTVNAFMIMTDGSAAQEQSLEGAEVDFFYLSGEACCEDMDLTVRKLREQTQGEEILGAIMFSCSGRGPERGGLIPEAMADATRFAKVFPDVPCLGFYAGGEIGPVALAGSHNVFRKGRAAVQGFTAVFCLFIVPVVERRDYNLDDCPESVQAYVRDRLLS